MDGSEMTLARWLAKKAILAQWQREGRKRQDIEPSELAKAASAYLDRHREDLLEQARAYLERFAQRRRR